MLEKMEKRKNEPTRIDALIKEWSEKTLPGHPPESKKKKKIKKGIKKKKPHSARNRASKL